jgi:zinc protease
VRVDRGELPNGLRIVVLAEPNASEVAITMRYGVGDADDPIGREGLAHLVEHVMFEPVLERLETRALAFNGYTTHDSTLYVEHAAPDQLSAMLGIEADRIRATCDAVSAAAFERQREVVSNELRERADDDAIRSALATAVFGTGHPFARVSSAATVAAITREQVCAFVAQHYAPSNAVLVVSGDTTLAEVRPLVEAAFADVPRREVEVTKLAPAGGPHQVQLEAPVDREWVLLAWPMPADPARRAQLLAVAGMATTIIQAHLNGVAGTLELGAGSAKMLAIAVSPRETSPDDALANAKHDLTHTNSWFGSGLYEHAANRAIYQYVSALDRGDDRDVALADEVAAGRRVDVIAPLDALRAMSRDQAHDLIGRALDPDAATIVRLHPDKGATHASSSLVSTFREQRPRHPEDPAAAHAPLVLPAVENPLVEVRRYTLANGLNVVLAPLGTMPIVDVRLVFPTGTADDPAGKLGLAELAADALDAKSDPDTLRFIQAGGSVDVDAAFDHTAFVASGLAGQLDTMLQGLDGMVREGGYESAGEAVEWLNASVTAKRPERVAEDAWRAAIYGPRHPYVRAGRWDHADKLTNDDLVRFRATHYVPGGATLIVTGNFDRGDAERWIAYYFADWHGAASSHQGPAIHLDPFVFAQTREGTQLQIRAAFAAPADPATARVVAEMLDEASADVRDELAASYGVHAALVEQRLGSRILLTGAVDANRAADVARLLHDRLARLSSDEMLFVSARRRVVAKLRSIDTTASGLADRFVRDVDVARPTAEATAALTLDQIAPALAALDLARATILLRGPASATGAAATGFGRSATPLN